MRLETLREFTVFARELNVSRAARRLNLAQSTLSRHLIEMEKELGFDVIDRKSGHSLTSAGIKFLSSAEQMLIIYDKAVAQCAQTARDAQQVIIVQEYGGHPDVSARLSSLVGQFTSNNDNLMIEWERFSGYDLADAVQNGILDVGQTVIHASVLSSTIEDYGQRGLVVLPLYEEEIVYWMRREDPLAQAGHAMLGQLKGHAIAMPFGKVYNPMRDAMSDLFFSRDLTPLFSYSRTWSVSDMGLPSNERVACVLPPKAKSDSSLMQREDMSFVDVDDVKDGFITCLLFRDDEKKDSVALFKEFVRKQLAE